MELKLLNRMLLTLLLVLSFGTGAQAGLLDVGPVVPQVLGSSEGTFQKGDSPLGHGFPLWYRDTNRLPLELCLDRADGQCATFEPTPGAALTFPDPQNNVAGNFSDETFWWSADASIVQGGVDASLGMALEAAFSTGDVEPGAQVSFGRIRIRVDGLPSPGVYTVTTPYKQYSFTVVTEDGENAINFTEDIGIAEGGIFTGALNGSIDPFLYCVGAPFDINGAKYLAPSGGVCTNGARGGSFPDKNQNVYSFSVVGPGVNISTGQFTIIGKIYSGDIPTPLVVEKVSYIRNASGVQANVFATTQAMSNQKVGGIGFPGQFALANIPSALQLTGTDIPATNLATNNPADGKFYASSATFASPVSLPATVSVTNTADVPVTTKLVPLIDEVVITESSYAPATKSLKVTAESLEKVDPPSLEVFMADETIIPEGTVSLGTMAAGQLSVIFPVNISGKTYNIPPETVTVESSLGGKTSAPVNIVNNVLATITSPVGGTTLTSATHNFNWVDTGAVAYQLHIGTALGAQNLGKSPATPSTATTAIVTGLPTNGSTVYVRLYSQFGGVWYYNDYTYTSLTINKATITSPTTPSTFTGTSQAFTWNDTSATAYQLHVGTAPGAQNLGKFPATPSTATSATVMGLPTNGSTIYVRLYSQFGGVWYYNDYSYTSITVNKATMVSPTMPFTFTGTSQAFTWNDTAATAYQLHVGTTLGAQNLGRFPAIPSTVTSTTVTGLPINGNIVYVRLYSQFSGVWYYNDYTYTTGP